MSQNDRRPVDLVDPHGRVVRDLLPGAQQHCSQGGIPLGKQPRLAGPAGRRLQTLPHLRAACPPAQEEHPCALHSFDQIAAEAAGKLVAVFLDYDGASAAACAPPRAVGRGSRFAGAGHNDRNPLKVCADRRFGALSETLVSGAVGSAARE